MLRLRIEDRGLRILTCVALAAVVQIAAAQESPIPVPSTTAEESASGSVSPQQSVPLSPTPAQTPSPAPSRRVRISFVPPPLEGTISLGIYDKTGKLVRVLDQQTQLNQFAIGADGLVTEWDGKNDNEQDLPAGKYHARGYLIGPLKLQDLGESSPPAVENNADSMVKLRLVPNPLRKEASPVVELRVAFDTNGSYLQTIDKLPLLTLSEAPNLTRAWIAKKRDNVLDVWQDDGTTVHQFRITNVDQIMAFDCGEFELR